MKKSLIFELLRNLKAKPTLARKLKIFAALAFTFVILTGALTVWAGIKAVNFFAIQANEVVQSAAAQDQLANLKVDIDNLPTLNSVKCFTQAQSLLALQPWLERPAVEVLRGLKTACLEKKSAVCKGPDCENVNDTPNTIEGRPI